jgi:hypothetical protein
VSRDYFECNIENLVFYHRLSKHFSKNQPFKVDGRAIKELQRSHGKNKSRWMQRGLSKEADNCLSCYKK